MYTITKNGKNKNAKIARLDAGWIEVLAWRVTDAQEKINSNSTDLIYTIPFTEKQALDTDVILGYSVKHKIPKEIMLKVRAALGLIYKKYKTEGVVYVFWDPDTEKFFLRIPHKARLYSSAYRVTEEAMTEFIAEVGKPIVLEIHSHPGGIGSFFSGTDHRHVDSISFRAYGNIAFPGREVSIPKEPKMFYFKNKNTGKMEEVSEEVVDNFLADVQLSVDTSKKRISADLFGKCLIKFPGVATVNGKGEVEHQGFLPTEDFYEDLPEHNSAFDLESIELTDTVLEDIKACDPSQYKEEEERLNLLGPAYTRLNNFMYRDEEYGSVLDRFRAEKEKDSPIYKDATELGIYDEEYNFQVPELCTDDSQETFLDDDIYYGFKDEQNEEEEEDDILVEGEVEDIIERLQEDLESFVEVLERDIKLIDKGLEPNDLQTKEWGAIFDTLNLESEEKDIQQSIETLYSKFAELPDTKRFIKFVENVVIKNTLYKLFKDFRNKYLVVMILNLYLSLAISLEASLIDKPKFTYLSYMHLSSTLQTVILESVITTNSVGIDNCKTLYDKIMLQTEYLLTTLDLYI